MKKVNRGIRRHGCEICGAQLSFFRGAKADHYRDSHPAYRFSLKGDKGSMPYCEGCGLTTPSFLGLVAHYLFEHSDELTEADRPHWARRSAPSKSEDLSMPDLIDSIVAKGLNPADVLYDGFMQHTLDQNSIIHNQSFKIKALETTVLGYEEKCKDQASKAAQARDVMVVHSTD
jgi:hypothetical protein